MKNIPEKKNTFGNKALKLAGLTVASLIIGHVLAISLFVFLNNVDLEEEQDAIQDVRFGANEDTFVYRYCPKLEGKQCRLGLYNIALKRAYQFETPQGPLYAHWPSVSPDGKYIVLTQYVRNLGQMIVVNLEKNTYRFLELEPRDWVRAVFSNDGKTVYAYARLKGNEWGHPDDYQRQQNMRSYDIFEIRLSDEKIRRVSENPRPGTVKIAVVKDYLLTHGREPAPSYKDIVWQYSGNKSKLVKPETIIDKHPFSEEVRGKDFIGKGVYFDGASDTGKILFSAVNTKFESCCGYNLFIAHGNQPIRQLTSSFDFYGPSADISRNGKRVIYQMIERMPANRNYRNFVKLFKFTEDDPEKLEELGFFIIDLDDASGAPQKFKFPEKFYDYQQIILQPENRNALSSSQ